MNKMNKQRGLIMVSILAIAAGSAIAAQDRQVTIESEGKRVYRRVDHEGRVRLVRQLSDKPCREGRSWGYDKGGIWVDDGCRAIFSYNSNDNDRPGNGRPDWTKPSIGWETKRFKLESNGGRESRRIDTSGGVKLTKRLSDKPCTLGRNWGYDRNGVWVDDGCRAEFEVRTRNDDRWDDNPWNGVGNGVPRWALGDWVGGPRTQNYTLDVRSDGTFTLRKGRGGSSERGTIRGSQVRIGNEEFKLERRNANSISFLPIRSASGRWDFVKS